MTTKNFTGFRPEAFEFLRQLGNNNDRGWFAEHKAEYHNLVFEPMLDLVCDLSETMAGIDPGIEIMPNPKKVISRIYRDTRFSHDKSPYRTNVWVAFHRPATEWQDAPGFYFEITPEKYEYGMGFYRASKATMDRFRKSLNERPDRFRQAIQTGKVLDLFTLEGERYKRPSPAAHGDLQSWFEFKSFYLYAGCAHDRILRSSRLTDRLRDGYEVLCPLYQYLWSLYQQE